MPVIYIDADACPVKEDIYRVAKRYGLTVHVVTRVPIHVPRADWILPAVAGDGFDAVDDWIDAHTGTNDIVITNDILLAARCLKRGSRVLDPRGKIYDDENIGDALATRELMAELRQRGEMNLGPKKMGKTHRSSFLSALDLVINQALRSSR